MAKKQSSQVGKESWVVRHFAKVLMAIAAVGFFASMVLTVEKIHFLKDPSYEPSCNISPLISCGSVMATSASDMFGVPNTLVGVIGFAMLGTIAFALLAGAQFKRWFWLSLQAGAVFGLIFVHYLIFQSIFVINTLCPYCMAVWLVAIPMFVYVSLYNLAAGHIRLQKKYDKTKEFLIRHHADILVGWFVVILLAILWRFWYYWSTLL